MMRRSSHERLRAQREREAQIGVEATLVEFVEDDEPDAIERGVALQATREDAFGDDLDARARPDARVAAHAIAHGLADVFAAKLRDAMRGGARGEAPRLEHHDRLAAEPRCAVERGRNERRLAGAGRRLQDAARVVRVRESRECRVAAARSGVRGRVGGPALRP